MNRFIVVVSALFLASVSASASISGESGESVQEKFDRGIGISTTTFIPKGSVGAGVAFSYNNYLVGNGANDSGFSALMSLIGGLHGELLTFGVAPWASYFVMDNLSVGGRFEYSKTSFGIQNLGLDVMDLGLGISDFYYDKNAYLGSVGARYYVPFGNSRRFAMFTELRATGGYAQSKNYNLTQGEDASGVSIDQLGTYQDIYQFNLGVIPGITAFFTDEVALEVSIGLIGLDYQKVLQTTNQVDYSVMESSSANFKVNLLAINLGLSVYLQTGQNKGKTAAKKTKAN